MKKTTLILAISGALGLGGQAGAATNIIDDTYGVGAGSFELGPYVRNSPQPHNYMSLAAGSSTITGWTVGGFNGVDWLDSSTYGTTDGIHALDLSGTTGNPTMGSISTVIPTLVGMLYTISFNAFALTPATGVVTAGDLSEIFSPPTSADQTNPNWQDYEWTFTATSTETTITFATAGGATPFGPAIDNVVVSAVPEPSSLVLGGLFVVLAGARRKR